MLVASFSGIGYRQFLLREGPIAVLGLAGNLTILGSVANVIVVEGARRERVEIGFVAYGRVFIPLTILTLLIGWVFLVSVPV
jgi:Na+/H+ antiporter NhaD/arsenite permease-like protein